MNYEKKRGMLSALVAAGKALREQAQDIIGKEGAGAIARNFYIADITLYFIALELAIKVLWEASKGKEAPKTHDILALFHSLPRAVKERLREIHISGEEPWQRALDAVVAANDAIKTPRRVAALDESLRSKRSF